MIFLGFMISPRSTSITTTSQAAQDPEHRRLWSGARRLGAAGRYCYSEKECLSVKLGWRPSLFGWMPLPLEEAEKCNMVCVLRLETIAIKTFEDANSSGAG